MTGWGGNVWGGNVGGGGRKVTRGECRDTYSVAYLGFHFGGGGGSKFFWKSGGICMSPSAIYIYIYAARGKTTRLLGGFGGMLPLEIFKKWCNLVRFREYFVTILSKK